MTTSEKKRVSPAQEIVIWHCAAFLSSQVPKKCIDLNISILYILTLGTYSIYSLGKIIF